MQGPERLVVVLRHAHAETFAREDRLRELTAQGREEAAQAGHWVRDRGLRVDTALVSSAVRARQTWELFAQGAGCTGVEAGFDDALYSAGPDTVLECLRGLPEEAETVVFVGHNPTASMLVQMLADGSGDEALLAAGFPPGALAVLTHTGAWEELDFATARVVEVHVRHAAR